jgi:regulator of RNase E activity RraB
MYPKARNILLPDGKDPNDCYRENPEGFRELIDRLTSQARDVLSLAFERLDSELAKQESKTKVATDEIKTIWQEITLLIASVDSSIERDTLARYFHEKLKPLGVRKAAVEEEIDAAVKTFR